MFRRIAIVNRGEAAMRLIHAVRELNAAGGEQIETVALYTDAESSAKFVREADLGYPIGPAAARPYLDYAVLERALRDTGADAAWVGWGFVAEDPAFAELCERLGVTFIGPSAAAMRALGDKIGSKLLAEKVGVPVAPWSQGPVEDLRSALTKAETLGYPLMLKATAGGGGRGIRVVRSAQELTAAFNQTRDEAVRAFGSGVMFLETMLSGARHVEVQVVADGQGTAWAIGVRDCSVQRRNQKVIEESSSAVLAPEQVADAEGLGRAAGAGGGLPRRRHGGVPLPPQRRHVRLPRGQHPAAGRAPDHRADHRPGPGQDPARGGGRRPADRTSRRPSSATRWRPGSTPRTPTATSPRRPAGSPCWTCRTGRACGSTPASAAATSFPPTSTR